MISTYLNGRLGNNLFQYIFCRISAIKNKCNFYIPNTELESIQFYSYCMKKLSVYLEMPSPTNPHYWTGENLFNIDFGVNDGLIAKSVGEVNIDSVTDGTLLSGFYQSDYYMMEYRDIIIDDWFKFNEDVITKSKWLTHKYNVDDYCYIHLRGTDYKTIPQYYLPKTYYLKGIEYIKSVKPDIKFLVITDDVMESKSLFPDFDVVSNSTEIDFYLLSQSKYKIIPNSSFSWWASWLSKESKITIAPNNWFNYNNGNTFSPQGIKTSFFTYL